MNYKKNKKDQQEINPVSDLAMSFGKLPPQNLEAEEAVLGGLMIERGSLPIIQDIISGSSFYKEAHRIIFESIVELDSKSEPYDLLTITNNLRKNQKLDFIGGPYYLVELTQRVSSATNIEFHARIVSENHIKRELIRISSEVTRFAFDYTTDIFDLLDQTLNRFNSIYENAINRPPVDFIQVMNQNILELAQGIGVSVQDKIDGKGVISYFRPEFDEKFIFANSNLILIGGRPGMGKTSFAISLFNNNLIRGINGLFFSIEMSVKELANKSLACESNVFYGKLSKGEVNHYDIAELEKARDNLSLKSNPLVDDNPSITVEMIKAKTTLMKRKHDIKFVIIDYVQLITSSTTGNRDQQLGHISRRLKVMAKELGIPVIVLAQLSRETEKRGGDKRPMLADLRESGSLEQDADSVLFPYRPEYYGMMQFEDGSSTKDMSEIVIAKNRHGGTGSVIMPSFMPTGRFGEMENKTQNEIPDWSPNSFPNRDYTQPILDEPF